MLKSIVKKVLGATALFIATTSLVFALDINTANQAELDALKGIGPVKAKAIIEERSKNGNFKDASDLSKRVKGLGDKSVSKLVSSGLTIGGSSTGISTSKDTQKGITQSGVSGIGDGTNKNVKPLVSTEVSKPIVTKTAQEAKKEKATDNNKHIKDLNANIKTQKENADTNKVKPAIASDASVNTNKSEHKTSTKSTATTNTNNASTVKTQ